VGLRGRGKVRTATFALEDALFKARGESFHFGIETEGGNPPLSFVRVIPRR